MTQVASRLLRRGARKLFEDRGPSARGADRLADLLRELAIALEVAMLEVDARRTLALRRESQLDLGHEVADVFPFGRQLPREHQPMWRLPHEHMADVALDAVYAALEPSSALAG